MTRGAMADRPVARRSDQASLYDDAIEAFGPAVERLARSYETDATKRQDLLQEIHLAVWRSLEHFEGRCSLRTWVYRVAHNIGASHVMSERRHNARGLIGLDELTDEPFGPDPEDEVERRTLLARVFALLERLRPVDRQLVTLYLEGLDAAAIGDINGMSPGNVATRISRIKKVLARWAEEGTT